MKEITIDGTQLRVYEDGTIERLYKTTKLWNKHICIQPSYYCIKINKKIYKVHRIIAVAFLNIDLKTELQIDHIDRDIHNNKLENLRIVTHQENQFNRNFKGYYQRIDNLGNIKFIAHIMINGKNIQKTFKNEKEAIIYRAELKATYHVI